MKAYAIILASLLALGMTGSSLANSVPNTGSIFAANVANTAAPSYYACASINTPDFSYSLGAAYLFFAIGAIVAAVLSWIAALLLNRLLKQLSAAKMPLPKKIKNKTGKIEATDAWVPTFQ